VVSRYGLVAYASSLDVVGICASSVEITEEVFALIRGKDERDQTSLYAEELYRRKELPGKDARDQASLEAEEASGAQDRGASSGRGGGTELEFVIMVIAVSCVKLLSAHNSTQHTSRKHKV
jgi:Asp-tRNAAsn/Glu-tRNAGln amidotransferase A subunit and related amidases